MTSKLRTALGLLLLIAGVVAIPVPILPGVPLIIAGATLLGIKHPLVRRWNMWLLRRGLRKNPNAAAAR
jgi:uncharacterized protein YqgC (DUF456 family)